MITIHIKKKPPAQMTVTDLLNYVRDLEAENARLEESFQKATGEIAVDPLPRETVDRKRFNDAANEIGESEEWTCDKMILAVFVNELEEKLFGGYRR